MAGCIFCQIAAGSMKAEVVYDSPEAIAFLDRFPAARGHTMVVPKVHAPTLLDLDDSAVGGLFLAVKTVVRKVNDALRPTAFHVGWNHGAAAGQHVFHLHVHILPRFSEGGRGIQLLGEGADGADVAELAAVIRRG
jgi:histidine triad (HIT) family protein